MSRGAALVAAALAGCFRAGARDPDPPPRAQPLDEDSAWAEPEGEAPARPSPTGEADFMRLHVIDVGQGAAALLEFPCGAVLVDTGGEKNQLFDGEKALIDYLDRFFARRADLDRTLALLVVTHPHIDHTRGIAAVLGRYRTLNVLDSGDAREDEGGRPQRAMHEWLTRHPRVNHLDLGGSDVGDRGGATGPVIDPVGACAVSEIDPIIRALWSPGGEEAGRDPGHDSIVLRVDFADASALLPGDIELPAVARLLAKYEASPLLDADIYLVPDHGSRDSAAADLVARVSPDVAVISAGPYERTLGTAEEQTARGFAHPHETAIDQLTGPAGVRGSRAAPTEVWVGRRAASKGRPAEFARRTLSAAVYSTGWDGNVLVVGHANGWIEVRASK